MDIIDFIFESLQWIGIAYLFWSIFSISDVINDILFKITNGRDGKKSKK